MSDISRYLDYVDETYEVIVKHLVEKKLPPTDERIRLYFGVLVRPYYFWTQESQEAKGSDAPPKRPERKITGGQLEFLRDLKKKLKKDSVADDYLSSLTFDEASELIGRWKREKP